MRANATAIPVPSSSRCVCSPRAASGRKGSWLVSADPCAVVALPPRACRARRRRLGQVPGDPTVDLHRRRPLQPDGPRRPVGSEAPRPGGTARARPRARRPKGGWPSRSPAGRPRGVDLGLELARPSPCARSDRDQLVDARRGPLRGLGGAPGWSKVSPADGGQPVDEGRTRFRERHRHHVVRHPGPQPDGGDPGPVELVLERGLHAGGHVDLAADVRRPRPASWRRSGAVATSRTGRVWGAGAGNAPSPTTIRTPNRRGQLDDRGGENACQRMSGSGPDQVQDVVTGVVGRARSSISGQVIPVATPSARWSTGRRARWSMTSSASHTAMRSDVASVDHRGQRRRGAEPGVDPALEAHDQHRCGRTAARRAGEYRTRSCPRPISRSRPRGQCSAAAGQARSIWPAKPRPRSGPRPRPRRRSGRRRPGGCRPASSSRRRRRSRACERSRPEPAA